MADADVPVRLWANDVTLTAPGFELPDDEAEVSGTGEQQLLEGFAGSLDLLLEFPAIHSIDLKKLDLRAVADRCHGRIRDNPPP